MEKCPYCKGSGFLANGYVEKKVSGHKVLYPYTEPCYCRVNISINKRYPIISAVPLPPPEDTKVVQEQFQEYNYLMYGSEEYFLYLVKAYFMKGFMYKNFIVLEGSTIVEQYHVVRDDWLTTSHLNQFDLLALLFTSSSRYASLQDCIVDVIKNRIRIAKPTWIYARSEESIKETREYSKELEPYISADFYKKYNLDTGLKLKGFSSRKILREKNEMNMNDDCANI